MIKTAKKRKNAFVDNDQNKAEETRKVNRGVRFPNLEDEWAKVLDLIIKDIWG
ncbi:MAG: hypothetical protein GF364_04570 [Candidatus Lokiarchaeota archaeon]|nr:hypothetical protein [Candidatus Lokiarchaeota archaeon]